MTLKISLDKLITKFGGSSYKNFTLEQMKQTIKEDIDEAALTGIDKVMATKFVNSCNKKKSKESLLMAITEKMFSLDTNLANEVDHSKG